MRISDKMGFNQVNHNLQKNRGEVAEMQNQAAIQKRVTKPSDDPVAATKVIGARTEQNSNGQYIKNINVAKSFLDTTDVSLGEISEVLMRMKELSIAQANDAGSSRETRRVVAEEVAQAYNQLVQIGNRKLGDRYIFGGYKTTTAPFDHEGNYRGDSGDMRIQIDKEAFVAMNLPGNRLYFGEGLQKDGAMRSQNENPRDVEELQTYQQDRALQQIEAQEAEEDVVKLRGPASESPRLGTGFKSEVEEGTQGINILQALKNFEIALRVNDKAALQESIDQMDFSITQVVQARAQVGSRLQAMNHTQEALQKAVIDNKVTASLAEDSDVFQLVSEMSKADSTLKATLETSGKVLQPSLLDFLK